MFKEDTLRSYLQISKELGNVALRAVTANGKPIMDRNTLPGCDKAMVLNRVCRRAL
jgi:hypothetical protein